MSNRLLFCFFIVFSLLSYSNSYSQCEISNAIMTKTIPTTCSANDGSILFSSVTLSPSTTYTLTYKKDGVLQTPTTVTTNALGNSFLLSSLGNGIYSNFIVSGGVCVDTLRAALDVRKVCLTINPIASIDTLITGVINFPYAQVQIYIDSILVGGGFADANGNFSFRYDSLHCNSGSHQFKVKTSIPVITAGIDTGDHANLGYINAFESYYSIYSPIKGINVIDAPSVQNLAVWPNVPKAGYIEYSRFTPTQYMFCSAEKKVTKYNSLLMQFTGVYTLVLPGNTSGLAVSFDDQTLYVSNNSNGTIYVYDTNLVPKSPFTINSGSATGIWDVDLTSDGRLICKAFDNNLYIIDVNTAMPVVGSPFNLGAGSSWGWGILTQDFSKYVVGSNVIGGSIKIFDLNSYSVIYTSPTISSTPWLVQEEQQLNPSGTKLLIGSNSGKYLYILKLTSPYQLDSILVSTTNKSLTTTWVNDTFVLASNYDVNIITGLVTDSIIVATDTSWDYYSMSVFNFLKDSTFSITAPICGAPLPINNMFLSGENLNNYNKLLLAVDGAKDVSNMILERSTENTNEVIQLHSFVPINNSLGKELYEFKDQSIKGNIRYLYRVKCTDVDGKVYFSNSISLLNSSIANNEIFVYPNPVVNECTFIYTSDEDNVELRLEVVDEVGKKILQTVFEVNTGENSVTYNLSSLASGNYILRYYNPTTGITKGIKFSKIK